MAQIINDWEAMRTFRSQLRDAVDDLQEQLKRTEHALEEVANSWKDEQFRKYNDDFSKDKEEFSPLCDKINDFEEGPLQRLEEIIHEYTEL
jgi:hypothetical protein